MIIGRTFYIEEQYLAIMIIMQKFCYNLLSILIIQAAVSRELVELSEV